VSACWLHLYGIPMVNSPTGLPNDPVGLCQKCNSLSCGWHGVRTSSPGFLCVLCDNNSLVSSAAWRWLADGGEDTLPSAGGAVPDGVEAVAYHLALALGSLFSTSAGTPSRLIVATFEQWLAERPDYRQSMADLTAWGADWAVEVINKVLGVGYEPVAGVGPAGQYDGNDYGDPVRSLWARLDVEGRRLMAAAVLLLIALDPTAETLRSRLPAPVATVYDRLGDLLRGHAETNEICRQVRVPQ
jgi:hypothetical protein